MKSFKKYIDAEKYAMGVSKRELKSISIVHLHEDKPAGELLDFTVMDKKDEWFWGIRFVMLITNFISPFQVHSISPHSGYQVDGYPTKEMANERFKSLLKENYRKSICQKDLTPEQYFEECIKPYEMSKSISDEHRLTLINR